MSEHEPSVVSVQVADDRLAVLLDCQVPEDDLTEFMAQIDDALREAGIQREIPRHELAAWLAGEADETGRIAGKVLLKGKRPIPPKDGYLDWADDFFSSGFVADPETGAVDYRRRKARTTVAENELLVRIVPPVEGMEGLDVFGNVLPVARPQTPRIRAGKCVRFDEIEQAFFAETAGRIRWAEGVLAVDDVLVVDGSVGLKTGHVVHPGAVVIEEDVLEGSQIKAAGDVEVHGMVEAASIEAGGSLVVHGGITGTEESRIRVAGRVQARFLLDVHLEAGEDVVVEKEIVHSVVKSRGAVQVTAGRLVGGMVIALGGVTAEQIGSEGLAPTQVRAGEDFELAEKAKPKEEALKQAERNLERINAALAPLATKKYMLPASKRAIVEQLDDEARKLNSALQELHSELEELRHESKERAKPVVKIGKALWPETVLAIDGEQSKIKEQLPGPLIAHIAQGEIVVRPAHR